MKLSCKLIFASRCTFTRNPYRNIEITEIFGTRSHRINKTEIESMVRPKRKGEKKKKKERVRCTLVPFFPLKLLSHTQWRITREEEQRDNDTIPSTATINSAHIARLIFITLQLTHDSHLRLRVQWRFYRPRQCLL